MTQGRVGEGENCNCSFSSLSLLHAQRHTPRSREEGRDTNKREKGKGMDGIQKHREKRRESKKMRQKGGLRTRVPKERQLCGNQPSARQAAILALYLIYLGGSRHQD